MDVQQAGGIRARHIGHSGELAVLVVVHEPGSLPRSQGRAQRVTRTANP